MINKKLKLFASGFFGFFIFGFFINTAYKSAGDFFYARAMNNQPPSFFIANVSEHFDNALVKDDCLITAKSAASLLVWPNGRQVLVFDKQANQKMPIASLAKLMTAIIADEFYQPGQILTVSQEAVKQEEVAGYLKAGQKFFAKDLIGLALMESSNDAAYALAEPMGLDGFVSLMNLKAQDLGLEQTYFYNPHGVDPDDLDLPLDFVNQSTVLDMAKLVNYLITKTDLLEVVSQKQAPLYLANGVLHHQMKNTNELLGEIPEVLGGKTGFTAMAGECLLVIVQGKVEGTYYINVVLNSADRFNDMRQLIECVNN